MSYWFSGFCPDDWHGTTETDLQQMAAGGGDYEYAVWEFQAFPLRSARNYARGYMLDDLARKQKIITDKAYALAVERNLIPYSEATFLALMDEVEAKAQRP